jgi:Bacterial Ig-like domain (group 3)/Abnormal spindle-like microcephaly-assoc'd, ASPM-SPD-2-Hydin
MIRHRDLRRLVAFGVGLTLAAAALEFTAPLAASAEPPGGGNPLISRTFAYNGEYVTGSSSNAGTTFTVPANVHHLTITAAGGAGRRGFLGYPPDGQAGAGGSGGQVVETIAVFPGDALYIQPGADGGHGGTAYGNFYGGDYGEGDAYSGSGGRGGGASVVLLNGDLVAVAGGGGGGGGAGVIGAYTGGAGGSGIRGSGSDGTGYGAGSGGSGSWGATYGQTGEEAGLLSYGGGGGGGGGGWNPATGAGGGSRGRGGYGGGGGGGGGAGGSSFAAPSATAVAFSEAPRTDVATVYPGWEQYGYYPGWVKLSWRPSVSSALSTTRGTTPYGRSVTLTDTLTPPAVGGPTATGTVTFVEVDIDTYEATTLATVPVVNGTATYATTSLAVGTHAVRAVYNGDGNYESVTSSFAYPRIGPPDRSLTLTPNPVDFGSLPVHTLRTRTVTVTNTGSVSWELIVAASDNGAVNLPSGTCYTTRVQPGGTCTFVVSLQPGNPGPVTGTLTLTTNFGTRTLTVTGTGTN